MAKIKIKVAKNLKREAKDVCEDIHISLETAINVFLLKFVEEKRIPFEMNEKLLHSAESLTYPDDDKDDKDDKEEKKGKKAKDSKDDENDKADKENPALQDLEDLGQTAMRDKNTNKKSSS